MPPGTPKPPAMVKGEALAEWKRVVPELDKLGVLATVDRAILTTYCVTWARWVKLDQQLTREGVTVTARDGATRKNPCWQMAREAANQIATLAAHLALTPSARLRLPARPKEPEDLDGILD